MARDVARLIENARIRLRGVVSAEQGDAILRELDREIHRADEATASAVRDGRHLMNGDARERPVNE